MFRLDARGAACGFILFQLNPWEGQAHLLKIGLNARMRGTGAAVELFEKARFFLASEKYKEIFLEVAASNHRAIGFYLKCGFLRLCVKKAFYSNGDDAAAMLLRL